MFFVNYKTEGNGGANANHAQTAPKQEFATAETIHSPKTPQTGYHLADVEHS